MPGRPPKKVSRSQQELEKKEKEHGFPGVFHGCRFWRLCSQCKTHRTRNNQVAVCMRCTRPKKTHCKAPCCANSRAPKMEYMLGGGICKKRWLQVAPDSDRCRQCKTVAPERNSAHGMCDGCRRKDVRNRRPAAEQARDALASKERIPVAPADRADAAFHQRYVRINERTLEVAVFLRVKNDWKVACAAPDCCTVAVKALGQEGKATHCEAHGGGDRCPGAPGEDACPRDNAISVHNGSHVRYIKDGTQYCCACYCKAWPDDELSRNAKKYMHAKEQAVREFLEQRFADTHPQLKWVMDRKVEGTLRRPDHRPLIHLLGVRSHDLIIETDENSHGFYLCEDERNKERAVHLWLTGKKKPLFLVRFNPDGYDDSDTGKHVSSCWDKDNFGLPCVKPSKKTEWVMRLEKLAQIIEEYLVDHAETWAAWDEVDRPENVVHTIELFYDNVKVKKNQATQRLDGMKRAAKKRKVAAAAALLPPPLP